MHTSRPFQRMLIATAVLALLCQTALHAFSPYETYLRSGKETHVAIISTIKPDQKAAFDAAFRKCADTTTAKKLRNSGITSLKGFTREIKGSQRAILAFTYAGGKPYLSAAEAFETATASIDWKSCTTAHSRATSYGRHWLQMEWISFIRGLDVERTPTSSFMISTNVIPEKEQEYRSLHQAVWPGVVDQIIRGNLRNLCIHLVELDGELVEFLHADYMGNDPANNDEANKADPINQRWWKLTDACQKPFADVKNGIWAPMEPIK